MTDEPGIFTPFTPTPTPETPAPKPKRRVSGKRKAEPVRLNPPTSAPARRGRKPRTDKHAPDVAVPKLDLATAITIGASLKSDDAPMFTHLVSALQKIKKGQRDRIVAAIGKVFA